MDQQTTHTFENFRGNPVFAIWKTDEDGNKIGRAPIISFGLKKARHILSYREEIEQWLERETKPHPPPQENIDISVLSSEQQAIFKALLAQATQTSNKPIRS